jgi:hypothetical protein
MGDKIMSNFNYEKAYCTQALPAFENLNKLQKGTFYGLLPVVKDLQQQKDLNIPLLPEIREFFKLLSCQEIAELSRASYFIGHWKPSLMPELFNNSAGQSWKISNVCDQVLRSRFTADKNNFPYNLQIHEGKFSVTFSNKNCWICNEFGLATEKNLEIFKNCKLPFGELTLDASAKKLTKLCGDLWSDVDSIPGNEIYDKLLLLKKEKARQDLKQRHADKLASIEKNIENSKIELAADQWLIEHDVDIDNVIYYDHTGRFCFGWRNKINAAESCELVTKLVGFPYQYDIEHA